MPDSIIAMDAFSENDKYYLIAMDMSNAFYLLSTDGSTEDILLRNDSTSAVN